jgi:hypothetical protein
MADRTDRQLRRDQLQARTGAMVRYQADDPAWLESPYLTLAVRFSSTIGGFIGVYIIIYLVANLHRGFGTYWWLALALVIDIALNIGFRVARSRRLREIDREPRGRTSGALASAASERLRPASRTRWHRPGR